MIEHLNWGYLQLGLLALAFGGLQIWWISSNLRKGDRESSERGRIQAVTGADMKERVTVKSPPANQVSTSEESPQRLPQIANLLVLTLRE